MAAGPPSTKASEQLRCPDQAHRQTEAEGSARSETTVIGLRPTALRPTPAQIRFASRSRDALCDRTGDAFLPAVTPARILARPTRASTKRSAGTIRPCLVNKKWAFAIRSEERRVGKRV